MHGSLRELRILQQKTQKRTKETVQGQEKTKKAMRREALQLKPKFLEENTKGGSVGGRDGRAGEKTVYRGVWKGDRGGRDFYRNGSTRRGGGEGENPHRARWVVKFHIRFKKQAVKRSIKGRISGKVQYRKPEKRLKTDHHFEKKNVQDKTVTLAGFRVKKKRWE